MNRVLLSDREIEVRKVLKDKLEEETIVPILASALLRSNKRKEKEPWKVYRRAMANMGRALKIRLRGGPMANVYIDKTNYRVVNAADNNRINQILGGIA